MYCICCQTPLVRQVRHGHISLFCTSCWQDMPGTSLVEHCQTFDHHHERPDEHVLNASLLAKAALAAA